MLKPNKLFIKNDVMYTFKFHYNPLYNAYILEKMKNITRFYICKLYYFAKINYNLIKHSLLSNN